MTTRYITLPNQRRVSLGVYTKAWRELLATDPTERVSGWDWYSADAGRVLAQMREGLEDRINRRGNAPQRQLSDRRLFTKIRSAAVRGAIVYRCRWCGSTLDPARVNPNNQSSRYCSDCHH